jgi:hypothetical protein
MLTQPFRWQELSSFLLPSHANPKRRNGCKDFNDGSAVSACAAAFSQEKPSSDNPFSTINKRGYKRTKGILLRSAEKCQRRITASNPPIQSAAMGRSSDIPCGSSKSAGMIFAHSQRVWVAKSDSNINPD